jgi:hypothetical protein
MVTGANVGWACLGHVRVCFIPTPDRDECSGALEEVSDEANYIESSLIRHLQRFSSDASAVVCPAFTIVPVLALYPRHHQAGTTTTAAMGRAILVATVMAVDAPKLDTERWVLACD